MKKLLLLIAVTALACLSFTFRQHASVKGMVLVQTGIYMRGLDSLRLKNDMERFKQPASFFSQEFPGRRMSVSPFYIDKYEVTNAEYKKFLDANPQWSKQQLPAKFQDGNYLKDWDKDKYPSGKGNYPVVYVSWYAANAYARWMGKRLPMESEWEFTANGGGERLPEYPWGNADADNEKADFGNSNGPTRVGKYPANALEIYDMAGNVAEMCLDVWRQNSYAEHYTPQPTREFRAPGKLTDTIYTVIRGGSWNDPPVKLRNTWRQRYAATACTATVGFRCAMNANR